MPFSKYKQNLFNSLILFFLINYQMLNFKGGLKIKFAISILILIFISYSMFQLISIFFHYDASNSTEQTNIAAQMKDSQSKMKKNYLNNIIALFLGGFFFWTYSCAKHIYEMYLSIRKMQKYIGFKYQDEKKLNDYKYIDRNYHYLYKLKDQKSREDLIRAKEHQKENILMEKFSKSVAPSFDLEEIYDARAYLLPTKPLRKQTSGSFSESDQKFFYTINSNYNRGEANISQKRKMLRQHQQKFKSQMQQLRINNYREQIEKTKKFLYKLLRQKVQEQKNNKERIKNKIEEMYKCHLVWYQSDLGGKMMTDLRRQSAESLNSPSNQDIYRMNIDRRFGNLFNPQCQPDNVSITLDKVISLYEEGKIEEHFSQRQRKNTWKNDRSLVQQGISEIKKLIQRQIVLDSFFRFNEEGYERGQRKSVDQLLDLVLRSLQNSKDIFSEENYTKIKRFENHYEIIESLFNIFAKLLKRFLPSQYLCTICTPSTIFDEDQQKIDRISIFTVERKEGLLLHYGLLRKTSFSVREYNTKPGKENLFSIFMIYLTQMQVDLQEMCKKLENKSTYFSDKEKRL